VEFKNNLLVFWVMSVGSICSIAPYVEPALLGFVEDMKNSSPFGQAVMGGVLVFFFSQILNLIESDRPAEREKNYSEPTE
jgi:amino acid permease